MALSPVDLANIIRDEMPSGSQVGKFETLVSQAVRDAVAYGSARVRERIDVDFWGDGITTRFALVGRAIRLLDPNDWATPVNLNTAGIAGPTTTAAYTAGTGGALGVGTWLACHAFETPLGVTPPTVPTATVVAASGKITRGVVTVPTGATVADYLSSASGTGKLLRVATGGSGASLDLTTAPLATAPTAQVDYTALNTVAPDIAHLGLGFAPDGSSNPLVSTLMLATAIPVGARVRVGYTRTPLYPTDQTQQIGLDDDYLRLCTKAHVCRALALNSQSGDSTDYTNMEKELFSQVDALLGTASGRRSPRVNYVKWN